MINKIAALSIFICTIPAVIQCISVVGPRVLRPFSAYTVAVAGGSRAYTLYVAVEGRQENGEQYTQGREVQIQAGSSRLVDLEIGDPGPGRYALVARSTSGPLFSSSAALSYQARSFCVFVQTDKRVYQPGDTLNFRVIALDKYLLPLTGAVEVTVLDAGGSPVRQWAAVPLDKGLITQDLVLADEPALGEWTIQVEARGQTYSRRVLVADYVLPKFQMEMSMPKEVLFKDGRFTINVTAKHFNGLPVRGELTISSYAVFFSGLLQPVVGNPARKVVDINGQVEVVFDLKTDLDLAEDAARPLVVEAVLEERNTLIKQNVTKRILLLRAPYRLKVEAPKYFKPTLPYNVHIELVDSSGQILKTGGDVTVERVWDDGAPVNITTVSLTNGIATYTIVPDRGHVNSTLNLVVKYNEVTERVINIQRNDIAGGQFIGLELVSRTDDELRLRASATEPMDLLHYVVIGRGDILLSKTLELSPARLSVDVTVSLTGRMAPGCVVLAWHPRLPPAAALLAASLYVPHAQLLQHIVTISPVSATAVNPKPNTLVELRVAGESGSSVALLGAPASAAAAGLAGADGLGGGLDTHTIEREVESFSGLMHSVFKNEEHLPETGVDLGGYTSYDVFKNSGLVILTDGVITQNTEEDSTTQNPLETGTRPPLAGPYAFSRLPAPPSPRYYLPITPQPTWTLANLTIGNDGKGVKERWTPTIPSELTIGAFAIHPVLGLGLASPVKFSTSIALSISMELPATLQRGESLAAVVTLKTTLAVDTPVEVSFYSTDQYFEFEPLDNDINAAKQIEVYRRVRVTVPAKGSISTAFLVTAVRVGLATIMVEASGNGVADQLSRTIDIQDGYEEELFAWSLLDARKGVSRANVSLEPVPGVRATGAALLASGDLLAAALPVLRAAPPPAADPPHALRPLATACVLLDYLKSTGQEEAGRQTEARALAAVGYQRLMAYRRKDGSFAADIDTDAEGDVWMTSVALRWISRCARHLEVSPEAARAAGRWLAAAQQPDGYWAAPHAGNTNDPRAQAQIPLTAYALIALLQMKGSDVLYRNNINSAVSYLVQNLTPDLDAYTLAVVAGALAAARNPQVPLALQIMDKWTNTSGSGIYWSRQLTGSEWRNPWLKGNSVEATTAAWGIRAMLAARLTEEALPVLRYLLQAYRPHDPDPEVLDALAHFAETVRTTTKMRIAVNVTGSEEIREFQIGDNNLLIVQSKSIRNSKSANAVTEGRGLALVGLAAKGSTNVTTPWPRYTLDPRVDQVSTRDRLQLSICFGYVAVGNETESGLTLLTVRLPSGYFADINTLTELTSVRHVVRARLQDGGARVVAWVRAARAERCATLAAPRALPTARQRPGWATLQDLYDSSHRARQFFQPIPSSACDVCREWASCARACGAASSQRGNDPNLPGSGTDGKGKDGSSPDAAVTEVASTLLLLLALVPIVIQL